MSEQPSKAKPAIVTFGSNVFVALVLAIRTDTPVFETWRTVDGRWINERFPFSYEVEYLPGVDEEIVAACHDDRSMDALFAALGADYIQDKLNAARVRNIEQLTNPREWEPQWTHGTFRLNLLSVFPLQTVWPIDQDMLPPDGIILHPVIQSVLMQPPTLAGWHQLFELGTNLHISHESKVRRAMIKFMEFREMAMHLLVLSNMSRGHHLRNHVSCIGIDNLKSVWSLLGGGSPC